jgi:hypothetical protein
LAAELSNNLIVIPGKLAIAGATKRATARISTSIRLGSEPFSIAFRSIDSTLDLFLSLTNKRHFA